MNKETLGERDYPIHSSGLPIPPPPPAFLLHGTQTSFLLKPHPEYPHEWNPTKPLALPGFPEFLTDFIPLDLSQNHTFCPPEVPLWHWPPHCSQTCLLFFNILNSTHLSIRCKSLKKHLLPQACFWDEWPLCSLIYISKLHILGCVWARLHRFVHSSLLHVCYDCRKHSAQVYLINRYRLERLQRFQTNDPEELTSPGTLWPGMAPAIRERHTSQGPWSYGEVVHLLYRPLELSQNERTALSWVVI